MASLSAFDRTNEFQLTANSMKSLKHSVQQSRYNSIPPERLEYLNYTQELARHLSLLNIRIEKLSELSSSSLFNDKANDIEAEFSDLAKELRNTCTEYESLSTKFPYLLNGRKNQSKSHCFSIAEYLNTQISVVSDQFKSVLRQRSLKQQSQRAKLEYLADEGHIPETFPTSVVSCENNCPALLRAQNATKKNSGNVYVDVNRLEKDESHNRALHQEAILQTIQEEQHLVDMQEVNQVNSKLQEMTSMFQHIATLVAEQGEQITRIDMNVAETENYVEQGYHELLKYLNSITKSRWFFVKIFAVIAIFLFLFFLIF